MPVLKVLSTNAIAGSGTEYQVVQTGYYRVLATAAASTVSFNGGPAITLVQNEALLLKSGAKPGQARIIKAVSDSTADYQLGTNIGEMSNTHPFSVGDFIAVEDDSTSPAIDSNFLSAGTAGKKVTALSSNGTTISTDVDSSSASADYTYAYSGPQAVIKRCVSIAATGNAIVVEEVQRIG